MQARLVGAEDWPTFCETFTHAEEHDGQWQPYQVHRHVQPDRWVRTNNNWHTITCTPGPSQAGRQKVPCISVSHQIISNAVPKHVVIPCGVYGIIRFSAKPSKQEDFVGCVIQKHQEIG